MRPSNKQRSRNKPGSNNNNRRNVGNIINRVFESAGPDGKVRGTPQQIIDKYQALARDAQVSGDRVAAESYLQHSEHYSRLLGEAQRQQMEARQFSEREDDQSRDETTQREDGGYREERDAQREPRREMRREPQDMPAAAESSGLTTIETTEAEDAAGPVETPEAAAERARAETPAAGERDAGHAPAVNGAEGDEGAEDAPAPPKRSRTRRKPKPADPVPVEAEAPAE
jgi:Domain of unknown function (DUF4167)